MTPVADVPPTGRNVNTVFQHYALFPHMDVAENVGFGLRVEEGRTNADRAARRRGARARAPDGYDHRRSWELSGASSSGSRWPAR